MSYAVSFRTPHPRAALDVTGLHDALKTPRAHLSVAAAFDARQLGSLPVPSRAGVSLTVGDVDSACEMMHRAL